MKINNIPYLYRILKNIQKVCSDHGNCKECPFKDTTYTDGEYRCAMINELSRKPYRMDIYAVCELAKRAIERGYDI